MSCLPFQGQMDGHKEKQFGWLMIQVMASWVMRREDWQKGEKMDGRTNWKYEISTKVQLWGLELYRNREH